MNFQSPVKLYIACSIDGFIAGPDDDLSFLSKVERDGEDYGYATFVETVDTVILGRKTYDKVLGFGIPFPHADRMTYVMTSQQKESEGNVRFFNGSLHQLVSDLKAQNVRGVFVDGGASVVNQMLTQDLIDEIIVSTVPVILGKGVRLFGDSNNGSEWQTESTKLFESGLIQTRWTRLR